MSQTQETNTNAQTNADTPNNYDFTSAELIDLIIDGSQSKRRKSRKNITDYFIDISIKRSNIIKLFDLYNENKDIDNIIKYKLPSKRYINCEMKYTPVKNQNNEILYFLNIDILDTVNENLILIIFKKDFDEIFKDIDHSSISFINTIEKKIYFTLDNYLNYAKYLKFNDEFIESLKNKIIKNNYLFIDDIRFSLDYQNIIYMGHMSKDGNYKNMIDKLISTDYKVIDENNNLIKMNITI